MNAVKVSSWAMERLTSNQWSAIYNLIKRSNKDRELSILIMVDTSLPEGYVSFDDGTIYGGISPEGEVST